MPDAKPLLIIGCLAAGGALIYGGLPTRDAAAASTTPVPGSRVVSAVSPAPNSTDAGPMTPVVLTLAQPLDAAAFDPGALSVFARWSGVVRGEVALEAGGSRIRFVPGQPFQAGEWVTASLRRGAALADGGAMETGFTWNFWVRPDPGSLDMIELGARTVLNEGEEHVQPYGAYAGDFNHDGYPDLAIPNEVSADVRIMLNDGTGNYEDFGVLEIPDGDWPSPNEGADFNGDGITDFAVGNAGNDLLTVFLGDGRGWFTVGGNYRSGQNVRGVCIMDANHDGWADVATVNMSVGPRPTRGNVAMFLNEGDGTGKLTRTAEIASPGQGEKTCAVGDANGDGHPDLFVGAYFSGEVLLYLGDGEGGLALETRVSAGGQPWMVSAGDLNGDGHVDVVTATETGDNVSVIFGDGAGGLAEPVSYPVGERALAVDLGDLDGDGDLEVVSSEFDGNSFTLYENAGDGTLINPRKYSATTNGSCAIIHDRDRDGDLDITGVDEMADTILLFENPGA